MARCEVMKLLKTVALRVGIAIKCGVTSVSAILILLLVMGLSIVAVALIFMSLIG